MDTYEKRLESFNNINWNGLVCKKELAKDGFYYLNHSDWVKCFICFVQIHKWELNDDITSEHLRLSPFCAFLRNRGLKSPPIDLPSFEYPSIKTNGNDPSLCSYVKRWETFQGWPEEFKTTPNELASLGFIYLKNHDSVQCFNCLYKLENWQDSDLTLFQLHSKHFICTFVHKLKEMVICKCGRDLVNALFDCDHFYACYKCAVLDTKCKVCGQAVKNIRKIFNNIDFDVDN